MDELLKLGPPATGEIVIKVDPTRTGSAFAMGTESLAPGAAIPVHRHVSQDEVWFIHKGQGRATLEGKSMTVLPGVMLYVPRNAWHGLRNTGTGLLQFTWTSAPPGIEEFFREVSRLGASSDAAAVQAIAQRHGMEFHPSGEAATVTSAAAGPRRRHRR
ncbi:MAG: cupin domain-containing protein, partial [Candidatus Omnitrophota bacterium]|nr:cupin domain-containing protein [Candidatus Omnitrophota bacterium]